MTETTVSIAPNTLYVWGEVSELKRDTKVDEFNEYFEFCEGCKAIAKSETSEDETVVEAGVETETETETGGDVLQEEELKNNLNY